MNFEELLNGIVNKSAGSIRVGYICRIESYNATKNTATIQPLWRFFGKDNKKYGVIPDVPIAILGGAGIFARCTLEKNDLVLALFVSHPMDNAIKGQFDSDQFVSHGLQNAIVLGTITTSLPLSDKEGFVIANDLGTMYAQFSDSKIELKLGSNKVTIEASKITLEGDVVVKGKLDVDQDITWNNGTVKTTASTHTHGTGVGPSTSPTPGS